MPANNYIMTATTTMRGQTYLPFTLADVALELAILRQYLPRTELSNRGNLPEQIATVAVAQILSELMPHTVVYQKSVQQQLAQQCNERLLSALSLRIDELENMIRTLCNQPDQVGIEELPSDPGFLMCWLPAVAGDRLLSLIGYGELTIGLVWTRCSESQKMT